MGRRDEDTIHLFARAKALPRTRPTRIVTDKLPAYVTEIRENFYSNLEGRPHLGRIHLTEGPNNNHIERLNGSFKDRTKTMRTLKTQEGAEAFANAFVVQYDFLRVHESLHGLTPAIAAGVRLPFEDGWTDLCRWATSWRNGRREARIATGIRRGVRVCQNGGHSSDTFISPSRNTNAARGMGWALTVLSAAAIATRT